MRSGAGLLIAGLAIGASGALAACGGSTATPLPSLPPDNPSAVPSAVVETLAPATEIPAASKAPSASTKPSGTAVYKVKKGDNMSGIAARYGITLKALMKLNPKIKDAAKIHIGQSIIVPKK